MAAAFEAFAQRMRAEYDAEPSPRTSALFDSLRHRPPAAACGSGGAGEAREDSTSGRDAPPGSSGRAPADLPDEAAAAAPPARRSSGARWALVAVTVVALALAGWWAVRIRAPRVAAPEPTIAVLPFLNMSGDPSREYLADGITEELLNLLAQVNGLQVAARTSAFAYKNSAVPVDSIGRALRVRHVLEGSVRESGERLRITAQLIDARSGYHLWSGTFDARLSDLFAVQDSIGRAIVDRLRPQLAPGAVRGREARDPLAHVAVMMGWSAFRKNSAEAYRAAAAHFAEAIARDSGYAAAYAGLATVRHWQANLYYLPADSAYEESRALAARSLALDSTNVDGWMVLARLAEVRDRDFAAAETRYARAVAVAPSDARPYARRAILLARLGRPGEALASARRAVELDPASPATHSELARLYQELGRFEDAERELRVALSLDPGHPILLGNLGLELAHQKKFAEAATVIAQARAKVPDDVSLMGMHAFAHANLGRGAEARALLDSAEAAGLSPYNLAVVYELLGERERAIALLARAVRERDDGATALLDSTAMPSLRDDPRYRRLVGEVRARSR